MRIGNSLSGRLSCWLIVLIGLIFSVTAVLDYSISKDHVLEEARLKIREEVKDAIYEVETLLVGVQKTTDQLGIVLGYSAVTPQLATRLLDDLVEGNRDVIGAAIALDPAFVGNEKGFATYVYRDGQALNRVDLTDRSAQDNQIANNNDSQSSHVKQYYQEDWFRIAKETGNAHWSEPYFDTFGAKQPMVTYAVPVYQMTSPMLFEDQNKQFIGVVTGDIALSTLKAYLDQVNVGDSGFVMLASQQGKLISFPDDSFVMKSLKDMYPETDTSGAWQTLYRAFLSGEQGVYRGQCYQSDERCIIGYSPLAVTGWPMAVIIPEEEFIRPILMYLFKVIGLGVFTLILVLIAIRWVTRSVMAPLVDLSRLVGRIGEGDLTTVLPQSTHKDEVARLIDATSNMQNHLKQYIRDLADETALSNRLQGEMDAATRIQMAMLPGEGELFCESRYYQLYARLEPAKSVGGDLYFCHQLDEQRSYFVIGDVSDKGVPAALFMAKTMTILTQLVHKGTSPEILLDELNNVLVQNNDACMFVTLWCGILDHATLRLEYASGGHMAPLLIKDDIQHSDIAVLDQENGMALGLMEDMDFPLNHRTLDAGDLIFLYTDGIDEAQNPSREFFGMDRMKSVLAELPQRDAQNAGKAMYQSVKSFAEDALQSDDITIMAIQLPARQPVSSPFLILPVSGEPLSVVERCDFSVSTNAVRVLFEFLERYWAEHQITESVAFDTKLAAEELLSNAVKYALLQDSDKIQMIIGHTTDQLFVEFVDQGKAFNPLEEANCVELGMNAEDCAIGGLGVFLVKEVTDHQAYSREGNQNRICFSKFIV